MTFRCSFSSSIRTLTRASACCVVTCGYHVVSWWRCAWSPANSSSERRRRFAQSVTVEQTKYLSCSTKRASETVISIQNAYKHQTSFARLTTPKKLILYQHSKLAARGGGLKQCTANLNTTRLRLLSNNSDHKHEKVLAYDNISYISHRMTTKGVPPRLEVYVHTALPAEILRGFNEHVVLPSVNLRLGLVLLPLPLGEAAPCCGARTVATWGW